ncbi:MAG: hemolysin family protein [Oscillospiraceae bacterium]
MDPFSILAAILGVFFLVWTAVFSFSETAMLQQSESRLKKAAEEGDARAKRILDLLDHPAVFYLSLRGGACFGVLLAGMCAIRALFPPLTLMAERLFPQFPSIWLYSVMLVLTILLVCFLVITLGLLVPRKIAVIRESSSVCLRLVRPACVLLHPLLWFCRLISHGIVRLLGMDPSQETERVTEEEIRLMVDAGNESGAIEESQKEMINNIFDFDDRSAGDIMTHRTEVTAIEADATLDEITQLATQTGYSRFPVYEDTMDDIIGILYVKDLLRFIGRPAGEFDVRSLMREALYVPESNRCRDLFAQFTAKKVQLAVVIDEYGGTSGIVTMEDLLESIVGNIQDEYDNEEEQFIENPDGTITADGAISLDELSRRLDWELHEEEEDYDTLGGLILERLGYIPEGEEQVFVTVRGYRFTVVRMDERHIQTVKIEKLPAVSAQAQER